jgi:hypothetical protein
MDMERVVAAFIDTTYLGEVIKQLVNMGIEDRFISAYMDPKFRIGTLPTTLGPLRGSTMENIHEKLIHVGLSSNEALEYRGYLLDAGAVVVVSCYEQEIEGVMNLLKEGGAAVVEVIE